MPVISSTIRKARKFRRCDNCGRSIAPHMKYVRAYGYAHGGDKPYAISVHWECAGTETKEKLRGTAHEGRPA